jgi:hypothetical protein
VNPTDYRKSFTRIARNSLAAKLVCCQKRLPMQWQLRLGVLAKAIDQLALPFHHRMSDRSPKPRTRLFRHLTQTLYAEYDEDGIRNVALRKEKFT